MRDELPLVPVGPKFPVAPVGPVIDAPVGPVGPAPATGFQTNAALIGLNTEFVKLF